MACLGTSSTSRVSLWLNNATLVGIPSVASRHNTPSRAHALCSMVESEAKEGKQAIIVSEGKKLYSGKSFLLL